MKKILLYIAVAGMMMFSLASCNSKVEPTVTWFPVNLMMFVQDQNGNDLLDTDNPNNIVSAITLHWEGKDFKPLKQMPSVDEQLLSLLNTSMFGEEDAKTLPRQGYFINFGQIDGALELDTVMFLSLPDGPMHEIRYHCANHNEKTQTCERYWVLDGKMTDNPFVFTLNIPEI